MESMNESAVIEFYNSMDASWKELLIPLFLSANELVQTLNKLYHLGINTEDVSDSYLAAENPIVFLRGNKSLKELGIHNGSRIIYMRGHDELSI